MADHKKKHAQYRSAQQDMQRDDSSEVQDVQPSREKEKSGELPEPSGPASRELRKILYRLVDVVEGRLTMMEARKAVGALWREVSEEDRKALAVDLRRDMGRLKAVAGALEEEIQLLTSRYQG